MSASKKVLFVDDEKNILRSLQRLLIDQDEYAVLVAESGEEALKLLEHEPEINLVISDDRMPKMDGFQFLSIVREKWPDKIRILLSVCADTASGLNSINLGGIYKLIMKPWNEEELETAISEALQQYQKA